MSNFDRSPPPPVPSGLDNLPPPPPEKRSGCVTAFMVIAGIVLLLPGLCALLFGGIALTERSFPSDIASFIALGLLFGFMGVMLIWHAIRGSRS